MGGYHTGACAYGAWQGLAEGQTSTAGEDEAQQLEVSALYRYNGMEGYLRKPESICDEGCETAKGDKVYFCKEEIKDKSKYYVRTQDNIPMSGPHE